MSIHKRSKNDSRLIVVMPSKLKRWLRLQSVLLGVPICQIVIDAIENHKPRLNNTAPPKATGVKANASNT